MNPQRPEIEAGRGNGAAPRSLRAATAAAGGVLGPAGQARSVANTGGILVVDEAPANLQVLAGMLKDHGYKARHVSSGQLALVADRCDTPDLILLDINLPAVNGCDG